MNKKRISAIATVSLLAAVTVLLCLAIVPRPVTVSSTADCQARALPSPPPAEVGSLLAHANSVARNGRLEAAEGIYNSLVAPGENAVPAAAEGLRYVQARRDEASRLVANGQALAARGDEGATRCFTAARRLDRENDAALAAVTARDATPATVTESGWNSFYARWLGPAIRAALPVLGLLVTLLVLARVTTSTFVPPHAWAWPDWIRRAAWWTGLSLLVVTAMRLMLLTGWQRSWMDGIPTMWRPPVLAVAVVLVIAAVALARAPVPSPSPREQRAGAGGRRSSWLLMNLAIILGVLIGGYTLGALGRPLLDRAWPWLLTILTGLLGLVLLAAGRGHALRLRVEVRQAGTKDAAAAAYVLARLQDLGDSPPRGLKSPDLVDVTDLPAAALSSLSTGKLGAVLAPTVDVLRPSVPWRAVVDDCGPDRLVITLTRNGPVVRAQIIDGARYGAASASRRNSSADGASSDSDRSDLLTAAAALILTELAIRHTELTVGLCGATDPESVAAHVVATRHRQRPLEAEPKAELLGFAVERDPRNALARAAYVGLLGDDARTPGDRVRHARRLQRLHAEVGNQLPPDPDALVGYAPLRLRLAHSLAASWLNACVSQLDEPQDAATNQARLNGSSSAGHSWDQAVDAYHELLGLLRDTSSNPRLRSQLGSFADTLSGIACALFEVLTTLGGHMGMTRGVERPPEDLPVVDALSVIYDRACVAAARARRDPGEWALAVDHLERVTRWRPGRAEARRDPFFASLRTGADGTGSNADRFWDAVAEPVGAFLDLPVFGDKGPALRGMGIVQPSDLIELTNGEGRVEELCTALEVPPTVIGRWRAVALAVDRFSVLERDLLAAGADAPLVTNQNLAAPGERRDAWFHVWKGGLRLGLGDAELAALHQRLKGQSESPPTGAG